MKPTGATKEATVTIYRVGDSVHGKRHLAYSAVNSAFCGRVSSRPKLQWLTFCKASLPLPSGVVMCRQCERSSLNQPATPSTSATGMGLRRTRHEWVKGPQPTNRRKERSNPEMATMMDEQLSTMKAANLPRLDWRTMVTNGANQLSAEDVAALDTYFQQFIQTDFTDDTERRCPCCQSSFGKSGLVGWLMSGAPGHATLEWGLANGEAFCSQCQYPFRVYHRDVGPIKFLSIGLPYHPDGLALTETDS